MDAFARFRPALKFAAVSMLAVLAACAGTLPPDATPKQIARSECRTWLGQQNLSERPRRGTAAWDQVIDLCVAKTLSAAGEIDRALESAS